MYVFGSATGAGDTVDWMHVYPSLYEPRNDGL
jgi:hypothetical protein